MKKIDYILLIGAFIVTAVIIRCCDAWSSAGELDPVTKQIMLEREITPW